MYKNFSTTGKIIVAGNLILAIAMFLFHGYNIVQMKVTQQKIAEYRAEYNVSKNTAIERLKKDGVKLFIGGEFHTLAGFTVSIFTIILSVIYIKNAQGAVAIILAICSIFTSFIGGLLILYMIFSGHYDKRIFRK